MLSQIREMDAVMNIIMASFAFSDVNILISAILE